MRIHQMPGIKNCSLILHNTVTVVCLCCTNACRYRYRFHHFYFKSLLSQLYQILRIYLLIRIGPVSPHEGVPRLLQTPMPEGVNEPNIYFFSSNYTMQARMQVQPWYRYQWSSLTFIISHILQPIYFSSWGAPKSKLWRKRILQLSINLQVKPTLSAQYI